MRTTLHTLLAAIIGLSLVASGVGAAESRFVRNIPANARVIVFMHGVLGDGTSTWLNPESKNYWPKLVADDKVFSASNVYVFEYPSPAVGKSLSVNELAEVLRRRLQADGILKHNEIIFLSHSMGGLVTRAFLLKNREQAAKVKFAYFFATPTEGSPVASLASLASRNAQFKNMYPLKSDGYLADLQRDWLSARLGIRSFCAYEGRETFGLQIVDQRSASNLCTEPLDPIDEDHLGIVKPKNTNADSYIAFRNAYETVATAPVAAPHVEATYKVCVGARQERCPVGAVFLSCGQSIAEWAAKECSTYSQLVLNQSSGGKCGYTVAEIKCSTGK